MTNLHSSRPPDFTFHSGEAVPNCWVALNPLPRLSGKAIYAAECAPDGSFSIAGLQAGTSYQLVVWDKALYNIISMQTINMPVTGADVNLGDVAIFNWLGRMFNTVFYDANENGFRDAPEHTY